MMLVVLSMPSRAAVIVVDTLADGITGPLCDIRDAISAANLDPPWAAATRGETVTT